MCKIRKCSRDNYGRQEVCRYHYQINRRSDLTLPRCTAKNCLRTGISKSMCPSHFKRFKNYGDMFDDIPLTSRAKNLVYARLNNLAPAGSTFCHRCNDYVSNDQFKNNKHHCSTCVRWITIFKKYRMTEEQFNKMFESQKYRCAICKIKEPGGKGVFVVDHCHDTHKTRGLLCHTCNANLIGSITKKNLPHIVKYIYPSISIKEFRKLTKERELKHEAKNAD